MYIDIYFLINLIVDRCSLECALRKYNLSGRRLWLGALAGAVGACVWELSGFSAVLQPVWALLLAAFMIFVCIGKRPIKQWSRVLIEMYGFSFVFAGVIPYVSRFLPIWIGSVLLSYAGVKLWLKWQEKHVPDVMEVQVETETAIWKMEAMVDTGHRLKDSITGKPVVIMRANALPDGIQLPWPICFKSVQGQGVMYGFWPKSVTIGERLYKEREMLVAVAAAWKEAEYEALVPGYVLKQ